MIQVKQTMSYGTQCCSCSVITIYGTYNVMALFMSCSCWNEQCKMLFPALNILYFTSVLPEVCGQCPVCLSTVFP